MKYVLSFLIFNIASSALVAQAQTPHGVRIGEQTHGGECRESVTVVAHCVGTSPSSPGYEMRHAEKRSSAINACKGSLKYEASYLDAESKAIDEAETAATSFILSRHPELEVNCSSELSTAR